MTTTVLERLRSTLFKPSHDTTLTLDDRTYRLIGRTAGGPLMIGLPAAAGWSSAFGGSSLPRALAVSERSHVTSERVALRAD